MCVCVLDAGGAPSTRPPAAERESDGTDLLVADVAGEQQALAAALALHERLGLLGVVVLVEVEDGDVGALARKVHRDGAADARVAACMRVFCVVCVSGGGGSGGFGGGDSGGGQLTARSAPFVRRPPAGSARATPAASTPAPLAHAHP